MPNLVDIVNNTYGTWKVISKAESKNKHVYWNVECTKCGSKRVIGGTHLKNGTAAQCICNKCNKSADEKNFKKICPICKNEFFVSSNKDRRVFCYKCSPYHAHNDNKGLVKTMVTRRKALKINLVKEKGGKCEICGYDKCVEALQFHHKEPNEKDFSISQISSYTEKTIKKCYEEIEKCMLVCANCHAEIHAKLRKT